MIGVNVNTKLLPFVTETLPDGDTDPPVGKDLSQFPNSFQAPHILDPGISPDVHH